MTEKQLSKLIAAGKVKIIHRETGDSIRVKQPAPLGRIVAKVKVRPVHPQKTWIAQTLLDFANINGFRLLEEYRFHPTRMWRFDWVVVKEEEQGHHLPILAVEYEGLTFKKSGHTHSDAYTKNTDKYNAAELLGWPLFRFTYLNYGTLTKTLTDFKAKITPPCVKTK